MAAVHDPAKVVIKKEIDDETESVAQSNNEESAQNQTDSTGSQKQTKVWTDDEVRSLIELQKGHLQKLKDNNYSKKQLMEDVAQEMNLIGYDATPENVRYKMKYLRARYKGALDYNAKHVEKKIIPFHDELSELFSMESYDDQELSSKDIKCNGSSDISSRSNGSERILKRKKTVPAPHVDLKTVVTTKKKISSSPKSLKSIKKKTKRAASQPLYQCGFCLNKFRTSYDMHDHLCKSTNKTNNVNSIKKKQATTSDTQALTIWLKPTGNAPIVKNKKWTVEKKQTIAMIMTFLKKYMNLEPSSSMFLYVNQSFAPCPDIEVGTVYDCFNINGKLVLHYSTSPAWG